jgi:hypothetical protein
LDGAAIFDTFTLASEPRLRSLKQPTRHDAARAVADTGSGSDPSKGGRKGRDLRL